MRLHQVAYATQAHKDSGRAVGARSLSDIAGFAPTTLHALGVRVSAEVMRKQHDLLVTNVPGPQVPLYAAGARLAASYPVLPLAAGHLLTVGVTSYDGEVYIGLTADRDAVRDLDVLAQSMLDALEELLDTTVRSVRVRQPTRKATPAARKAAAKKSAARQEAAARKATGQKRAAVRNLVVGARKATSAAVGRADAASDEVPAKKTLATKTSTKKIPAKKAPVNKAGSQEAPARRAPATKATAKKATAKKPPAPLEGPGFVAGDG
jgi:diacylglycerol O-acyltransferase